MNALELYDWLIREIVSPALRDEGLSGSGGRYSLPHESHWAVVGFQKNKWNTKLEVEFTVNLMVAPRALVPVKPGAAGGFAGGVNERLGALLPSVGHAHKNWWNLTDEASARFAAQDVLSALRQVGIPWLREQLPKSE